MARSGQVRSGQIWEWLGQVRSGQVRSNHDLGMARSGQVRSGNVGLRSDLDLASLGLVQVWVRSRSKK